MMIRSGCELLTEAYWEAEPHPGTPATRYPSCRAFVSSFAHGGEGGVFGSSSYCTVHTQKRGLGQSSHTAVGEVYACAPLMRSYSSHDTRESFKSHSSGRASRCIAHVCTNACLLCDRMALEIKNRCGTLRSMLILTKVVLAGNPQPPRAECYGAWLGVMWHPPHVSELEQSTLRCALPFFP